MNNPRTPRAGRDKQGLPASPSAETDESLFLDDTTVVASATECTGLMPTPPANEGEAESYSELYPVPEVENRVDHGLQTEQGVEAPQKPQ